MKAYTVGELRKVIKESTNEFKPKMGDNVIKDDKKNNDKAYKDIEKETSDYNGGIKPKLNVSQSRKFDYNQGMQDLVYNKDSISKPFADRVKAQMNGYTSVEDENKHKDEYEGNAIFGLNTKELENKVKQNEKDYETLKISGLAARTHPEDFKAIENGNTVLDKNIKESLNVKRIHFKKTKFLSENHMISKIPEDFKKEGCKFIMEDNFENKYMIEWSSNKANILSHSDKLKLNEQLTKIKSLFNITNDVRQSTSKENIINENNDIKTFIDKAKMF